MFYFLASLLAIKRKVTKTTKKNIPKERQILAIGDIPEIQKATE